MSLQAEGETIPEKQNSKIKRQNDRVFTNLTPFIPLSFKGEGDRFIERGFTPLLPTLPLSLLREGGQGIGC